MKFSKQKGVTLIALVLTILVLLILVGVTSKFILGGDGIIDKAVQSGFVTNFRAVEEGVQMYISEKKMIEASKKITSRSGSTARGISTTTIDLLPVTTQLTSEEKEKIKQEIPTLAETIKVLNEGRTIEQRILYWIDLEKIDKDVKHKYIIDAETYQIYDYEGENFQGRKWHTLGVGIYEDGDIVQTADPDDEIWDGWITLNLYYPSGATEKQWRLSEEGETRYDGNLTWEDYTGPIKVRLSQVENIWIKYKIDGEEVIVPPLGKMLVDIQVDPVTDKTDEVKVQIKYDENAITKQYRINGGEWKDYTEEFTVTENVLIEAKGIKEENVYDDEGNIISTSKVTGRDAYFIRNIGKAEIDETLAAPTIQRLTADGSVDGEVAKVKIIYPDTAKDKIYKIDYGKENDYTEEISITKYGTEIIAYYRTTEGKTSRHSRIIIDENNLNSPEEYIPNASDIPTAEALDGPTINITNQTTQATIKLTTAKTARKIYIQLGNGKFQEYTEPVVVKENMIVRAYYISEADGETSKTSYAVVKGIHEEGKPTLIIDADPYPYGNSKLTNQVVATISTDATEVEYSFDGLVYEKYTGQLTITKNCRLYARATNSVGTTEEYLDITNLGNEPSEKKETLGVSISVSPEPSLSNSLVDSAQVTINYDEKAEKKYYSIGKYGTLQEYKGQFIVNQNCTIYAYAISENASGSTLKMIDNLTTGIAEPVIEGNPTNGKSSTKTKINITFDKTATITRYEVNGNGLRDYVGEFEVTENCTIRAVNSNSLGQSSESIYKVTNIVPEPPKLLLDRGDYYLLKLPFPEISSNREYKYKEDGTWKTYDEKGIVLIKAEHKDEYESKNTIEIIDENGNKQKIDKEHCYVLDVPISEIFQHISMRWDRSQPKQPTIILDTIEPAKEVTVTIKYDSSLVKKEYCIVYPDGETTGWKTYKEAIKVTQKGTVIYARGMDDAEVYTTEAIKEITNIDEEQPVIKLAADLENTQQKVGVRVTVTDDVKVEKVKWAKGQLGESYFANSGTAIENNSVVQIEENGYYTFYAEDSVGNKQTYTLNVGNVDKTPPEIEIAVSPENTVGIKAEVTIDYGDSSTKQYKVGENNTIWTTYTEAFSIESTTILAKNWQNEDGTVTIYAKGTDDVGNEITVSKKVLSLDLDAPSVPVISSNYGYPVLTEYGVTVDGSTTIVYDTRNDITNYYSTDGTNWQVYTGEFSAISGTIYAKSVKNASGLEVLTSKTISMPSDAMSSEAYDGDLGTYIQGKTGYIVIDESVVGKVIEIKWSKWSSYNSSPTMQILGADKIQLEETETYTSTNITTTDIIKITVPENAKYLYFKMEGSAALFEVRPYNEPQINLNSVYPTLTEYKVESGYNTVTIDYFTTSVQRLYSFDNVTWYNYQDKSIKLDYGTTIYAKGIDKYGKETYITSLTSDLPSDAMSSEAYDGDLGTYIQGRTGYIAIDESVVGKVIEIKWNKWSSYNSSPTMQILGADKKQLEGTETYTSTNITTTDIIKITVPENAKYLYFAMAGKATLYEVRPYNDPSISIVKYPRLTNKGVEVKEDYAIIKYFDTSLQKLYSFDNVNWYTYKEVVAINPGSTIYAKGIDRYGTPTQVVSLTSTVLNTLISSAVYDDDLTSYVSMTRSNSTTEATMHIYADSSIWNKTVYFNVYTASSTDIYIYFYNSSGSLISSKYLAGSSVSGEVSTSIPENTAKIGFSKYYANNEARIYEIYVK